MGQAVGIVPSLVEIGTAPAPRPAPREPGAPAVGVKADPGPSPADLRLVIEADEVHGGFIYKTLDRNTGEVVRQFPRDQLLRLMTEEGYEPGEVIAARA